MCNSGLFALRNAKNENVKTPNPTHTRNGKTKERQINYIEQIFAEAFSSSSHVVFFSCCMCFSWFFHVLRTQCIRTYLENLFAF